MTSDNRVELEGRDYVIRFAYPTRNPDDNQPIALTADSWYRYTAATRDNPDAEVMVITTTGQELYLRAADCGAGCRCALSWRRD